MADQKNNNGTKIDNLSLAIIVFILVMALPSLKVKESSPEKEKQNISRASELILQAKGHLQDAEEILKQIDVTNLENTEGVEGHVE